MIYLSVTNLGGWLSEKRLCVLMHRALVCNSQISIESRVLIALVYSRPLVRSAASPRSISAAILGVGRHSAYKTSANARKGLSICYFFYFSRELYDVPREFQGLSTLFATHVAKSASASYLTLQGRSTVPGIYWPHSRKLCHRDQKRFFKNCSYT